TLHDPPTPAKGGDVGCSCEVAAMAATRGRLHVDAPPILVVWNVRRHEDARIRGYVPADAAQFLRGLERKTREGKHVYLTIAVGVRDGKRRGLRGRCPDRNGSVAVGGGRRAWHGQHPRPRHLAALRAAPRKSQGQVLRDFISA